MRIVVRSGTQSIEVSDNPLRVRRYPSFTPPSSPITPIAMR